MNEADAMECRRPEAKASSEYAESSIASGFVRVEDAEVPGFATNPLADAIRVPLNLSS